MVMPSHAAMYSDSKVSNEVRSKRDRMEKEIPGKFNGKSSNLPPAKDPF